ncbi:hypothetical protein BKH42_08660 [Helicobacter sp. 13S00482-2]|nr:hypothetical protein BKH42_08660 [Helicobacter sp. 13S00482-2]
MVEVFEDIELKKWALMHEVFEGLTGMDIPTPIKHTEAMEYYREAEERALIQAARIFGLNPQIPDEIKIADKRMMVTEALQLMNTENYDWTQIAKPFKEERILRQIRKRQCPNGQNIYLNMKIAEDAFLLSWRDLFGKI